MYPYLSMGTNNTVSSYLSSLLFLVVLLWGRCSAQQQLDTTIANNLTAPALTTALPTAEDFIAVSINLDPAIEHFGVSYVAANKPLKISAILDPQYNKSALVYLWSTKEGSLKQDPHASAINYTFTKSDEDNIIHVNVTNPVTNDTGSSRFDVTVKSPVVLADPVGKLFLEKGELLDISLVYSGSPPFKYCYKFCTPFDIIPCELCFPTYETNSKKIPIVHYLHNVGNYTLMFRIENIMNYEERHYVIRINDTVRTSNMPIAPIVSSILAVCILITGVGLHMRFKDSPYNTETANFDFFHDDQEEWEQELSFIQRVRYLFRAANPDDEDETRYLLGKNTQQSNHSATMMTTTATTTATRA